MCGGGGYRPPPPPVVQEAAQPAVAPAAGARKKTTKQVPRVGGVVQTNLLGGTTGIGDDALNLGGKTMLGGGGLQYK